MSRVQGSASDSGQVMRLPRQIVPKQRSFWVHGPTSIGAGHALPLRVAHA